MRANEFCNIKTLGEKASAVNMVFKMLMKGGSGDLEVDESLSIHNHLEPATIFAVSTMVVDLGMVNHPYLVESYNNLIVKGSPPTEMGTATFDNIMGNNTKKCAPGKDAWQKEIDKGRSPGYTIPLGKKLADSYSAYLFNPFKEGRKEATLHITREQVLQLNPGWLGDRAPAIKGIHIGVNKQGDIVKNNKYYSYIEFEEGV
jgi:hypothetical protein